MARTLLLAVLGSLVIPACSDAATRQVPAQHATIQAAIDASSFGDVIQVAPGTYHEHLFMQQAGVAIIGAGADVTTIHGSGTGRVIEFFSVGTSTKLSGFRITGGVAATGGGGIRCVLASPQILDCVIEGNTAPEGGGVFLTQSRPEIKGCTIRDNDAAGSPFAQHEGGGVLLENNSPALIENCEIMDNAATRGAGIRMRDAGAAIVRGCRIRGNAASDVGGGVHISSPGASPLLEANVIDANTAWGGAAGVSFEGPGTIRGCTIAFNTADHGTGGVVFHGPGTITHCTIAFNTGTLPASGLWLGGVSVDHTIVARNFNAPGVANAPSNDPAFACNDVWGHQFGDYHGANPTGTNSNISENPLFCNPGLGDLGLATGSPCSAALNPCGLVGALGVTCAATEVRRSSWGDLKSRYR